MRNLKNIIFILITIFGLLSTTLTSCAAFTTSSLTITPQEVAPGEPFTVSTEVTNAGNSKGIYKAALMVDGLEVDSDEIFTAPRENVTVSFTLTEDAPGTHQIAINDMTGSFTVFSPEDVVDKTISVIQNDEIDSYQKKLSLSMKADGIVDGEKGDISINLDVVGTVDNINRRMWAEISMGQLTTLLPRQSFAFNIEQYIVGNDRYILLDVGDDSSWYRQIMPVGSWNELPNIALYTSFLDTSEVKLTGSEEVREIDCYVFEIIPDNTKLTKMLLLQTEIQGRYQFPLFTEGVINELCDSVIMRQWVSKDTYYVIKQEVILSGTVGPDVFEIDSESSLDVEIIFELVIYNHNKPVQIDLPPDAQDAIGWQDSGDVPDENLAAENEFRIIQAAVVTMMDTNGITSIPNPATEPTNDMRHFPDITGAYILYGHKKGGLFVDYVMEETTKFFYVVDKFGMVAQLSPDQQQ